MTALQIIFYAFAAVAISSGLMVVIAKNSVHGVLFLVLTFFAMSGIWILLNAEFLALILLLVYVGAVMTLFLFVVMMLNLDKEPTRESFVRYLPLAALAILIVVGLIIMVVGPQTFGLLQVPSPLPFPANYSNTVALGSVLYTEYAYPFEVAGALLLTAIIAAITLSHRVPKNRKVQNVSKQVEVKRDQRVKLVNIPSEKKMKPTKDTP
jgi:NADH-quinone oxidoreductase subunit J